MSDEAVLQPAGHRSDDEDALAALRWGWGEAYRIGHDASRGWRASRRDDLGDEITADDSDALWRAIKDDYDLKPVPRLPSPGGQP
jgi:hypothetical protein